ncbi:MAG: MauE/DoxX family redox-associated membrane protein [Gammaproteobacteria bacterium]
MPALDPILTLTANYCVALLFLFACYSKVRSFGVFHSTLADYELVPGVLVWLSAILIVVLELVIGFGALFRSFAGPAMALAAALLLLYAAAIGINLVRGRRDIDCGCTGPATQQLLSGWLLLRNIGLAALAIVGAAPTSQRLLHSADFALVGMALLASVALYAAINQLMANAPRLDALDSLMEPS